MGKKKTPGSQIGTPSSGCHDAGTYSSASEKKKAKERETETRTRQDKTGEDMTESGNCALSHHTVVTPSHPALAIVMGIATDSGRAN